MSGRAVYLVAAAAVAAAASLFSVSSASAGCYGGCAPVYQTPVPYYATPVVYSYSYAAPVAHGCGGCGYPWYGYAPVYVVNPWPVAYTYPVVPVGVTAVYYEDYSYHRAPQYYGGHGYRTHRHWHHRHHYGRRVGHAHRFGVSRYRYGEVVPGRQFSMRHPVGPRGIQRPRYRTGAIPSRQRSGAMHHYRGGMKPGTVHQKKP